MFNSVQKSLRDLLGDPYIKAISNSAEVLLELDVERIRELTDTKVEFLSARTIEKCDALLEHVGKSFVEPFHDLSQGAPAESFRKTANLNAAPIGGLGCLRIGQDGRIYIASKSENYHAALGHHFAGYKLITMARELGILNATNSNTRGFITRKMESELVRCINGLEKSQEKELQSIIESKEPGVLNRILNLQTGSLAVEAGVKMMLNRFYRIDNAQCLPEFSSRTPVFLVMEDNMGGMEANYHGTTIITQTFRGMWPELYEAIEKGGVYKIVSVKINDREDFRQKMEYYNTGMYKTAGFLHEIVLMNYGATRLDEEYLQEAYALCKKYDTPTMADEIQSCMWYKGMFLFKQYHLKPDFVILGKGFPGGEYSASKIITTCEMDSMNQYGALVTNGQEELASLAYLITMEFEQANEIEIQESGDYFQKLLNNLQKEYPDHIEKIEGIGHLAAIHFKTVEGAVSFTKKLTAGGIDISAQTYKANCPPAALLKLPLIVTRNAMDYLKTKMTAALENG